MHDTEDFFNVDVGGEETHFQRSTVHRIYVFLASPASRQDPQNDREHRPEKGLRESYIEFE